MALTNAYLQTTKNLHSIINSVISAKAPERFTNKFLEDLGFKSSNDRLYIGLFKALGLLDENLMANTFKALCELADWSVLTGTSPQEAYTTPATSSTDDLYVSQEKTGQEISKPSKMNLHYNMQIHLPETTNMAVYDAIFQSLKKHLM